MFRKDNKVDAFQRQISALRQQLGTGEEGEDGQPIDDDQLDDRDRIGAAADDGRYGADNGDAQIENGDYGSRDAGAYAYRGYGGAGMTDADARDGTESAYVPAPMEIPTPQVDAQTSVIAHDTTWKGDLHSNGTVHVHGRVEGSIRAEQDVYVAEEADVDATVTATNMVVAGLVKGTVRCASRFEVLPQGRVAGDVQAPTLVVHEGATMTGQFRMGANASAGAGEPAEGAAVGEAPLRRPPSVVQRRAVRGG